jgi:hypothetical protein
LALAALGAVGVSAYFVIQWVKAEQTSQTATAVSSASMTALVGGTENTPTVEPTLTETLSPTMTFTIAPTETETVNSTVEVTTTPENTAATEVNTAEDQYCLCLYNRNTHPTLISILQEFRLVFDPSKTYTYALKENGLFTGPNKFADYNYPAIDSNGSPIDESILYYIIPGVSDPAACIDVSGCEMREVQK